MLVPYKCQRSDFIRLLESLATRDITLLRETEAVFGEVARETGTILGYSGVCRKGGSRRRSYGDRYSKPYVVTDILPQSGSLLAQKRKGKVRIAWQTDIVTDEIYFSLIYAAPLILMGRNRGLAKIIQSYFEGLNIAPGLPPDIMVNNDSIR